jgi:predicted component of type VI protein secretion system
MVVILRDGALVGTEAFPPGNYRVGSGDDCDLHLEDDQVSPLHASILFADGQVGIADEGGQGGVFVNGEPVQNAQVSSLDEVRVGAHVMKMRVVTKRKPAAAPASAGPAPDRGSSSGTQSCRSDRRRPGSDAQADGVGGCRSPQEGPDATRPGGQPGSGQARRADDVDAAADPEALGTAFAAPEPAPGAGAQRDRSQHPPGPGIPPPLARRSGPRGRS